MKESEGEIDFCTDLCAEGAKVSLRAEGAKVNFRAEGAKVNILNPYRIRPTILPLANLYIFKLPLNPFLWYNLILKSGAVLHLHLGWFYCLWFYHCLLFFGQNFTLLIHLYTSQFKKVFLRTDNIPCLPGWQFSVGRVDSRFSKAPPPPQSTTTTCCAQHNLFSKRNV